MEHVSWCHKNNIIIYGVVGDYWNELFLEINYKGDIIRDNYSYKQKNLKHNEPKWWEGAQKLYTNYYNKLNKNE